MLRCLWTVAAFVGFLAVPVAIRQAQVIAVMGWEYWWQDICYSTAIKLPFGNKIINLPPIEMIDEYYRAHRVVRPPAVPAVNMAEVKLTCSNLIRAVTIPSWALSRLSFTL